MWCNIDASNAGQTPDDRINWSSDVTCNHGDGCIVMLMIDMLDRHMMARIASCSDVL